MNVLQLIMSLVNVYETEFEFRSLMAWETEEELLLSGHQAPKLKLSFINIYKTHY